MFRQSPQPLSSLEWQFPLHKVVQDIGGRIWLGGTGSPAEQPSGFLVTLSLLMSVSRTETNRKRKPQCFLLRALSCGESDAFVSPVDESWWLLTDVLLSVSPKSSASIRGCHVQRCDILLSISPLSIAGPSSPSCPRHLPRNFWLLNQYEYPWALCQWNKAEVPQPKCTN